MKKIFYSIVILFWGLNIYPQSSMPGSGNALSFDGMDDHAELGTFFTYQNFTVDMWVKPGATQVTYADIIDNNHNDNQNWVCQQDRNNTNKYYFGCAQPTGGINCHFSLTANVWQHIALVKTATAIETYVNGILTESTPWNGTINFSGQFLRLGTWGGGGRNWNGCLDEVRIWNIPLNEDQIRERMCRKITAADPLFINIVTYYNFDETGGNIVIDRTANLNNGTLINGPTRITSGASIGNASTYNYVTTSLPAANLNYNGQDNFGVIYTAGNYVGQAGTHVYVVNEKPSTVNGIAGAGSNDRYFGVFNVNLAAPAYTAVYNYTGNPFVTESNEKDLSLYKRSGNSVTDWVNTKANINVTANTLTVTGQNTEYMLGVQPCGNVIPIVKAGGPTTICQGDSVKLICSPAKNYLWSNNDTTQSITVSKAGIYTVTVKDTGGCTVTSNSVKIIVNTCSLQQMPGSGNALSFDGINDHVDLGSSFVSQNFTIDMWIKPGATQITYADIIDNNHTDYQNWVCQQYIDNTNRYTFGCSRNTGGIVTLFTLTADVWQHVAMVKSSTAVEVYVNGILAGSTPWSGTVNFSNQFLRLGKWGYGGRNWNGSMDEIRIWNIALNETQIRERMSRKINNTDILFSNLSAYYNFDESNGCTVFDGTPNTNIGTLKYGTKRITSGAAIGNVSAYNYVTSGLPAVNLSYNNQDNLAVKYTSGKYTAQAGTHVYFVNEKPSIVNGVTGVGSNDRYFGVFNVNLTAPAYTAVYNYTGNPFVTTANEADISLFKRNNSSTASWINANANIDIAANKLTVKGQNTEYMLGVQSCGNVTPIVSAGGSTSFCQGGSVKLTSTPALNYLWSNGATTQSIIINNAGAYKVTVQNEAGCTATSATVKVCVNNCGLIYCAASETSDAKGFIKNVFACSGFNNSSGWNGYNDFSAKSVTSAPGKILGFSVTPGYLNSNILPVMYIKVWIDWNADGDFTDTKETVFAPSIPINVKTKFWVTVPAGVLPGSKRMRVALRSDVSPSGCGSFVYGEVEDYTVKIIAARPGIYDAADDFFDEAGNTFTVYPNPVTNRMTIERSGYDETKANNSPAQMILADANGKVLKRRTLYNLVQAFDMSSIANGIYFVTIITNTTTSTNKIIINH